MIAFPHKMVASRSLTPLVVHSSGLPCWKKLLPSECWHSRSGHRNGCVIWFKVQKGQYFSTVSRYLYFHIDQSALLYCILQVIRVIRGTARGYMWRGNGRPHRRPDRSLRLAQRDSNRFVRAYGEIGSEGKVHGVLNRGTSVLCSMVQSTSVSQ